MRSLPAFAVAACAVAVLVTAGCETRDSMNSTPNRYGQAGGSGSNPGTANWGRVPRDGEMSYTIKADDTLKSIANAHNTTPGYIIKRNDLSSSTLKVGDNIIVPRPGTPRQ